MKYIIINIFILRYKYNILYIIFIFLSVRVSRQKETFLNTSKRRNLIVDEIAENPKQKVDVTTLNLESKGLRQC